MVYEQILYEVSDNILTITLQNRPERLNAFTGQMMNRVIDAFDEADADDNIRAIIVTGAGHGFCAGADLSAGADTFDATRLDRPERAAAIGPDGKWIIATKRCATAVDVFTLRIFECLKPVIAAVNGPAVEVGATMISRWTSDSLFPETARFGFVFSRRGIMPESLFELVPSSGGRNLASARVGLQRPGFPPEEAIAGGLVSKVYAPDKLIPAARALAREIADNTSQVSVALIRQMFWKMLGRRSSDGSLQIDSRGIFARGASPDVKEGVVSFLEKRPAKFPDPISKEHCHHTFRGGKNTNTPDAVRPAARLVGRSVSNPLSDFLVPLPARERNWNRGPTPCTQVRMLPMRRPNHVLM